MVTILNGSFHYYLPPFSRFLNQSLNLSLFGAGNSRISVHAFNGPGPFEILSPCVNGFIAAGAILEPILYSAVMLHLSQMPSSAIFRQLVLFLLFQQSLDGVYEEVMSGIFTGHTSVQAPHRDDAYGSSLNSSYPPSNGDRTAPIGPE